jgi:hypothetical protein
MYTRKFRIKIKSKEILKDNYVRVRKGEEKFLRNVTPNIQQNENQDWNVT